jgi:hypothetical protein
VAHHSRSDELIFPYNPLVTVHVAFDPVLKHVASLGEQSDDLEPALGRRKLLTFVPIGRKVDRLSHCEFMGRQCHLLQSRRIGGRIKVP